MGRIILVLACYLDRIWSAGLTGTLITTGIFLIFALCVSGRGRLIASGPLVFLGTISYPLYLLHNSIGFRFQMMNAGLGLPPIVNLVLTIAIAIGVASAVTFIVERPANRKIRSLYQNYTSSRAPAVLIPVAVQNAVSKDPVRLPDTG